MLIGYQNKKQNISDIKNKFNKKKFIAFIQIYKATFFILFKI
jgi:hypothetical protein